MASVRHLGLFPFCVPNFPPLSNVNGVEVARGVGPLSEYPFTMPIRLCTRMWWTVKHWKISFDFYQYRDITPEYSSGSYTEIDASIAVSTKDAGATYLFDYVPGVENAGGSEKSLVCVTSGAAYEEASRGFTWTIPVSREFVITGPGTPSSGTSTVNISVTLYTNWDSQQLGFAPPFCRTADNSSTQLWTAMSFATGNWTSQTDREGETGSGTFNLLGDSFTFPISRSSLSEGDTETVSNLVIEPDEFWEYDPGDGLGPIYNKTTGQQIRAFPSN